MKIITIIRGISGSSKSTLASKILADNKILSDPNKPIMEIFEADRWFINSCGEYVFNASQLSNAHTWCRLSVEGFLRSNLHCVAVVSNTSTTFKEILPYAEIAKKYGALVDITEPNTEWKYNPEECYKKNKHNVPLATIEKQLEKLKANQLQIGTYSAEQLITIIS